MTFFFFKKKKKVYQLYMCVFLDVTSYHSSLEVLCKELDIYQLLRMLLNLLTCLNKNVYLNSLLV